MIELLLAHRTLPTTALDTAMRAAVGTRLIDPQVVLIDARRRAGTLSAGAAAVIPLSSPVGIARYDRPAPTLSDCDQLLSTDHTPPHQLPTGSEP